MLWDNNCYCTPFKADSAVKNVFKVTLPMKGGVALGVGRFHWVALCRSHLLYTTHFVKECRSQASEWITEHTWGYFHRVVRGQIVNAIAQFKVLGSTIVHQRENFVFLAFHSISWYQAIKGINRNTLTCVRYSIHHPTYLCISPHWIGRS